MLSEVHVFSIGESQWVLTPRQRCEMEALLGRSNPHTVARTYGVTVEIVMHVWKTFRDRHTIPAIMV